MAKTFEESWTEATADRLGPNRDLGKSIAEQCWHARDAEFSALQRELEDEKSCGFSMSAELESLRPREEWLEAENKSLEQQLREAQAACAGLVEWSKVFIHVDHHFFHEPDECSECRAIIAILHTPNPGTHLIARLQAADELAIRFSRKMEEDSFQEHQRFDLDDREALRNYCRCGKLREAR